MSDALTDIYREKYAVEARERCLKVCLSLAKKADLDRKAELVEALKACGQERGYWGTYASLEDLVPLVEAATKPKQLKALALGIASLIVGDEAREWLEFVSGHRRRCPGCRIR